MKTTKLNKIPREQIVLIIFIFIGILLMIFGNNPKLHVKNISNESELETKIARLIMDTYFIENVSVILTYDTNGEKITSDYDRVSQNDEYTFSTGFKEPFVTSEKLPYVRGVLISAPYINDSVCDDIVCGVSTLLGINPSKVNVIYQKNGRACCWVY